MTTVTFRNTTMAADTQVSGSGVNTWAYMKKIRKVDGYLIGGCGNVDALYWFLTKFKPAWVEGKIQPSLPTGLQLKDDDFEGLIVAPNKKVYLISEKLLITPIKIPKFVAVGSGERVAVGAMEFGATAVEAVRVAIKHDGNTGGRVHFIRL